MKRLLLYGTIFYCCLFCLVLNCCGQPSQFTVALTVVTGLSATPFSSTPLQNIGQGSHIVRITQRNNGGNTCSNFNQFLAAFEFTQDGGATWVRLASMPGDPNNTSGTTLRYISGFFQGFRISVYGFDTTNCLVDIFYTGSLNPITTPPLGSDGFIQGTVLRQSGTTAVTLPYTPGAPSQFIIPGLGTNLGIIRYYSATFFNSSAAAETVTLQTSGQGGSCGIAFSTPVGVIIPAGQSYTIPYNTVAFFTGISGAVQPCLALGANASTHNIFAQLTYRYEN